MADAVSSLAQHMNALTARLDDYSGLDTENVEDFISDFRRYCLHLGQESSAEQNIILASHLKKDAKKWFRLQCPDTENEELLGMLLARFKPTPQSLLNRKVALYAVRQQPDQTFTQYVSTLREKARPLNVPEAELVSICLAGSDPSLRPHLTMAGPQTFQALLALPLATDPSIIQSKDLSISAVIAEIQDLRSAVAERVSFQDRPRSRSTTPDRRPSGPHAPASNPASSAGSPQFSRREPQTQSSSCQRCGGESRGCAVNIQVCPAFGKICNRCSGRNHFAKFCRSKMPRSGQYMPQNYSNNQPQAYSNNQPHNRNFAGNYSPRPPFHNTYNSGPRVQYNNPQRFQGNQNYHHHNYAPQQAYRYDTYPPPQNTQHNFPHGPRHSHQNQPGFFNNF